MMPAVKAEHAEGLLRRLGSAADGIVAGCGRSGEGRLANTPGLVEFLKRRYASAIERDDGATAARLRAEIDRLINGRLAQSGPDRAPKRPGGQPSQQCRDDRAPPGHRRSDRSKRREDPI
jgi:hypothetical protein